MTGAVGRRGKTDTATGRIKTLRDTIDVVQRQLAYKTRSEQLWKERGGRQCGHLEKSISSQRDWPIGAGGMR